MNNRSYKNTLWRSFAVVMVFAPLARGAVRLWSITIIELIVFTLMFLWLWRVNNRSTPPRNTLNAKRSTQHARRNTQNAKRSTPHAPRTTIKTALDLPIAMFALLAVISCVFSIYKHASILELFRFMTIAGVFYLVVNNFNEKMGSRLGVLVIVMGTGMSLLGLGQYFLGLDHSWWDPETLLASTYVNHNHFAGYLEMAIPLAIGVLFARGSRIEADGSRLFRRLGAGIALCTMCTAFIFAQSRGGWICLTFALIAMNVILIRKGILRKNSLIVFLLVIVMGIAYICAGNDAVTRRFRTVKKIGSADFIDGRVMMWKGSVDLIRDNPLIGMGIGTFVWAFPAYRPEGLRAKAHYAHNEYLHMMVETGVLALPLMMWIICVLIKTGFGKFSDNTDFDVMEGVILGGTTGILSLALHGLVDFNFHIPSNMLVVAALAGIIMRVDALNRQDR